MKKQMICIKILYFISAFMIFCSFVLFEKKNDDYLNAYLEDTFSEELSKMGENDDYPMEYKMAMANLYGGLSLEAIRSDPARFFMEIALGISGFITLCIGYMLEGCIHSEDAAKKAKASAINEQVQAHHDERTNPLPPFNKQTTEIMKVQEKPKVLSTGMAAKE